MEIGNLLYIFYPERYLLLLLLLLLLGGSYLKICSFVDAAAAEAKESS
jgi:hypothetical protein